MRSLHGDPAVTKSGSICFNTRVPIASTEAHALERDTRSSVARQGGGNYSEPVSLVMGVCENKWVVSLRAFRLTDLSDAEELRFKIGSIGRMALGIPDGLYPPKLKWMKGRVATAALPWTMPSIHSRGFNSHKTPCNMKF